MNYEVEGSPHSPQRSQFPLLVHPHLPALRLPFSFTSVLFPRTVHPRSQALLSLPFSVTRALTRHPVHVNLTSYLFVVNDGDDEGVGANGAGGRHHRPLHIGESLAFADSEASRRDDDGSDDHQIHKHLGVQRNRHAKVFHPLQRK